ncbi:MAG TPA: hypothetical protein VFF79_18840 [Conexibacter sp.]|jgi:hypothetical protein|nr:hypothetical protein [Conexibacter sp.]
MHTTHEGAGEEREAQDGWRLVQLAQLVADLQSLGERLSGLLEDFTPDELHAAGTVELDSERRAAMVNEVCALRDAAEQIGWLGGDFAPRDHLLSVSLSAVARAAATMLSGGSANIAIVQLAARLLLREDGFPALAEGIEGDPRATAGWGEATMADVLDGFRDGSGPATAWVCASARVRQDTRWTTLGADDLARLAWALRNAPAR